MRSYFDTKKLLFIGCGLSMLLTQSCGSHTEPKDSETKASIDLARELVLGGGFDLLTGRRRGDCVTGTIGNAAAGDSNGSVDIVESSEELQKSLDVDAEVSVGFGPFSASAKSKYLKETQFKQNTLFVVIKSHRETQPTQIENVRIHPDFVKIYERSPEEFRAACGDTFVKSISKGAELTSILEVSYSSQADKELIKGSVQAGFAFASAKVSVSNQTESLLQNRQVRFRYFTDGSDMPVGAQDSVQGMLDIFNSFNTRVNEPNAERNFVPIRYNLIDYESLPLPTPQRPISRKPFMDKAETLSHDWLKANDCSNKAQYALNNQSEFEAFDLASMVALRDASTLAKSRVDSAIDSCFNPICTNGACVASACELLPPTITESFYSCSKKLPKPLPIQDAVYNKWRKFGGEMGELGKLKKSSEPYGNNALLFTFERGSIVYTFNAQDADQGGSILGKTFAVMGDIRDKWISLGGAFGRLGYPITDSLKDGQRAIYSIFQSGVVMSVTPRADGPVAQPARTIAVHSNRNLFLSEDPSTKTVQFSANNDYPKADEIFANGIGLVVRESGRPYVAGPNAVSHYINGELYKRYVELGGPSSWIGVPLGSEAFAGNFAGYDVWRINFDRASIVAVVGLGNFVTGGAIRARTDSMGYATLGVPTMDDYCSNASNGEWGCYTQFRGGSSPNAVISWTEAVGTLVLDGGVSESWSSRGGAGGLGWPRSVTKGLAGGPAPMTYTDVRFPSNTLRCWFNEASRCYLYQ